MLIRCACYDSDVVNIFDKLYVFWNDDDINNETTHDLTSLTYYDDEGKYKNLS